MDEVDLKLLRELQVDGRVTNAALAKRCGLSPAACFERVRRLRAAGIITGYTALLDPNKLDRGLQIYIEVLLDRTSNDVFAVFADHVRRLPEVMECHMVAGGFDYLLRVRVSNMEAYRALLGDTLASLPGIRETRTYPVLEQVKVTTNLPI